MSDNRGNVRRQASNSREGVSDNRETVGDEVMIWGHKTVSGRRVT